MNQNDGQNASKQLPLTDQLKQTSVLRADLGKAPAEVASMFDHVASRYDLTNDLLSFGQVYLWRQAVVNAVKPEPGQLILDLAAGTGTSANALSKSGADVIACDFSEGMLKVGRRQYPHLDFVWGDATDLPFADDQFDSVTISFGLRNVTDVQSALSEMRRVTKPGGKLVVCEFSTPTTPWFNAIYRGYLGRVLPQIAGAFSSDDVAYDYLMESILDWPNQEELGKLIAKAGWAEVAYRSLSGGIVALHRANKD